MEKTQKIIQEDARPFRKNKKSKINWTENILYKHAIKIFLKIYKNRKINFKKKSSLFFFANFNFDCDSYFFFCFFVLKLISLKILWNTLIIIIILIMILISISTTRTLSIFSIMVLTKKKRSQKYYQNDIELKWPKLENQNPTTSNPICLLSTLFKKNDALSETKILSTTTTTTTTTK